MAAESGGRPIERRPQRRMGIRGAAARTERVFGRLACQSVQMLQGRATLRTVMEACPPCQRCTTAHCVGSTREAANVVARGFESFQASAACQGTGSANSQMVAMSMAQEATNYSDAHPVDGLPLLGPHAGGSF